MLRKIYKELVEIKKELQAIRRSKEEIFNTSFFVDQKCKFVVPEERETEK